VKWATEHELSHYMFSL